MSIVNLQISDEIKGFKTLLKNVYNSYSKAKEPEKSIYLMEWFSIRSTIDRLRRELKEINMKNHKY